jgi:nitroimidazol reductase NimA-like FMN-containing flavoprotein (pyridoxamine 5'-phosphate oxidase superfamily)
MSQGVIRRRDKEMSRVEAEELLHRAQLAHFATIGPESQPYVVPNLFVYADGLIYLHTAAGSGHFGENVAHSPRVCFEAAEMGQVFPYGEFECDTSVSYASVIGFGRISIEADPDAKARFFDRFLAKYGDPRWARPKSFYPRLGLVTVYAIEPERMTGKTGPLPLVSEQWPARNQTKSPGAIAPRRD